MNLRTVATILRKELLDTLRDKRTLVMMVGVPVVLYPAMLIIGMQFALLQHDKLEATVSRVAIEATDAETVKGWIKDLPKIRVVDSEDPEKDLAEGNLDAVVVAKGDVEKVLKDGGTLVLDVQFDGTEFSSNDAVARVENALEDIGDKIQEERLNRAGLSLEYIQPLEIKRDNVAPPEKTTGNLLGLALPVIMVVMIALGAFYPAVDLTAGEKERGTFETLLSTPASKLEIVTGKFVTVFLLAMFTGVLNLASMMGTFAFLLSQLSDLVKGQLVLQIQWPIQAFFTVLLVMIPLAFFISALMMSIAVFARSFKEAQNYITPFFLVISLPAIVAGFPGVSLSAATQLVPIVNVVLLFKGLMKAQVGFEAFFVVFASTTLYAVLALMFAAWLFQREEVVLSEERGIPLSVRRRDFRPRAALTPGHALGLFALVLVTIFYIGGYLQQRSIIPGLLVTEWGLILAPTVLFLWYIRVDLKQSLSLRALSPANLLGTLLVGFPAVLLIIQVGAWHNKILPVPEGMEEAFEKIFATGNTPAGMAILLFAMALSPAICEEVLFRGAILSGIRQRLGPWPAIILVGLLFGLFHISIYRIIPTGIMGLVLTYLVVRTGSIGSSMIVHFIVNTLSILAATDHIPDALNTALGLATAEQQGLPRLVLVLAVACFIVGVAVIERTARKKETSVKGVS